MNVNLTVLCEKTKTNNKLNNNRSKKENTFNPRSTSSCAHSGL